MTVLRQAILLLLLAAPLTAQEAALPPEGAISVVAPETDAIIEQRIAQVLAALEIYEDVAVSVTSGVVTLSGTALDAEAVRRMENIVRRVDGVVAINDRVSQSANVVERLGPLVERFRVRLQNLFQFLPLMAVAVIAFSLILALGLTIAKLGWLWQWCAPNSFIAGIYKQIVRIVFTLAGLVVALDILGATALLGSILGAAGIIGLAIGFAVRDSVENFLSSILLSIRQPFRPYDLVEIGGDTGRVVRLTSRATILMSPDGNAIRIPNATVYKSRIVNFTANPEVRLVFDLGIDPAADAARVRALGEDTLRGLPFALADPAPMVWIAEVGDSAVILRFSFWIDQTESDSFRARGEAIRLAKSAIENAGVLLPETTYRVITQAGEPSASAPAAVTEPRAADPALVQDVHRTASEGVESMVEAERRAGDGADLLNEAAPKE